MIIPKIKLVVFLILFSILQEKKIELNIRKLKLRRRENQKFLNKLVRKKYNHRMSLQNKKK